MKNDKDIYILGISAFDNDSSASILKNGEIIAAVQEERFSRKKNDPSFPVRSVEYCLKESAIELQDVDSVVFYTRPLYDIKKIITGLHTLPLNRISLFKNMFHHIKDTLNIKNDLKRSLGKKTNIVFENNLLAYAASAFFPSPFNRAGILIIDSCGECQTTGFGLGENNKIKMFQKLYFPHSIKQLYSAFTHYCGFKINAGEYKLMGLAPYGKPVFEKLIFDHIVHLKNNGTYSLNLKFFNILSGQLILNKEFDSILNSFPRVYGSEITQTHMDIAASIQSAAEKIVLNMVKYIKKKTECDNICLAGNIALNCVINGKILESKLFKDLWVQPSPTDSGAALGAALLNWYKRGKPRDLSTGSSEDLLKGSLLGPSYSDDEIESFLKNENIIFTKLAPEAIAETIADLISSQKVIGWFQGRMEFGPRALGSRSILADARSDYMRSIINSKIKFRESFRPLAPSILEEKVSEYFYLSTESPYMLIVVPVKKEKRMNIDMNAFPGLTKLEQKLSSIPAVTHVDFSARVQTVNRKTNKLYYETIKKYYEKYGCPLVVNTSFNVRNEPIVLSPKDAYNCFKSTGIDHLIMGSFLINKKEQAGNFT